MKISFCVTCKDRLFHLSQTLPLSIINSSNYANREFVVLNYNSEDGMHEWAKKNLVYWESIGVVKYIRTRIPKNFWAAHAKNIAHKNATGDILCNLDSDNFVVEDFCQYLCDSFSNNPNIIVASSSEDKFDNHGCCGKISVLKQHFYSVNGYDESKELSMGWGWDDVNFRLRAKLHNNLEIVYCKNRHNAVISHDNKLRTANFLDKNIDRTQKTSVEAIEDFVKRGDYLANKGVNWGFISDLKIGLNT